MSTAVVRQIETELPFRLPDDRHGWGFALLLTVVATLFVRPADLIPALDGWPIFQCLIIGCLVVSFRAIFRRLGQRHLGVQPVTACLLLLVMAVGLSHLAHGFVWAARMSMYEVGKFVALFLLIVSLVNTQQRLTAFIKWLIFAITLVATLALLDRYGFVSVAALESIRDRGVESGEKLLLLERIRGTGIFQDPNDFGLILVTGVILSAAFLMRPNAGWPRHLWLIPSFILLTALALTHSRGALLSLAFAFPAALTYLRSWKVGLLSLLGLPVLALVFSERMTDLNAVHQGTGQSRIQIWSESLAVWRQYPVFGIGEGLLADELGVVTHNSFLHCFAELGGFGGTVFLASFLAAHVGLWLRRTEFAPATTADKPPEADQSDPSARQRSELAHLRLFVFAALAGYTAGMLTLSRQFVMPTYLMLGLATSAHCVHHSERQQFRIDLRFLCMSLITSGAALLAFYLAVRIFVRW